jgi:hypothetical protein
MAIVGLFVSFHTSVAFAQCDEAKNSYQVFPSENKSSKGKILITLERPDAVLYTFKVYKMDGVITLVQTKQAHAPQEISIEGLDPSTYFVKIEWREKCSTVIGGLDGIIVTDKDH